MYAKTFVLTGNVFSEYIVILFYWQLLSHLPLSEFDYFRTGMVYLCINNEFGGMNKQSTG